MLEVLEKKEGEVESEGEKTQKKKTPNNTR
jgi:hypothetical protein